MTPERRLMIRVIERAIEDAKSLIARTYVRHRPARGGVQQYSPYLYGNGHKFNPFADRDLQELKSHIRHPWFAQICDFAGISQDRVIRKITQLEERAKVRHARNAA